MDIRLTLYTIATILLAPFFLLRKIKRRLKKRYIYEFDPQRHTIPYYKNGEPHSGDALHVVFIASGLGEKQTAEQLSIMLRKKYPDVFITWAIKVDEVVGMIRKTNPGQAVTYMPFDNVLSARKWFKAVRPDVVVSVENIWMPCIAWYSKNNNAGVVVVSGNSGRFKTGFLHKNLWKSVNRWSLQAYDIICLRSTEVKETLRDVLPEHADVRITGIAKLNDKQQELNLPGELLDWLEVLRNKKIPLLAAGSTRSAEEEDFVLEAFKAVREQTYCKLLLAPRHLHRVDEVARRVQSHGCTFQLRSELAVDDAPANEADVLILDSLGELNSLYAYSQAAFVGGTLRAAGHNVLEPVAAGVPVFFGPGQHNIPTAIQQLCLDAGIGFRVTTASELAEHWLHILTRTSFKDDIMARINHIYAEQERIIGLNLQAIVDVVEAKTQEGNNAVAG